MRIKEVQQSNLQGPKEVRQPPFLSIKFWGPRESGPGTTLTDDYGQQLSIIGGLKDIINNLPLKSRTTALERRVKGPFEKPQGNNLPSRRESKHLHKQFTYYLQSDFTYM